MNEIMKIEPVDHFRKRPGMYMGKASIFGFQCVLAGIGLAEQTQGTNITNKMFPALNDFEKWLAKKYKDYTRDTKSFGLALKRCNDDDHEAFYLWFQWYDEFIERNDNG